jgi:hypothetical protein
VIKKKKKKKRCCYDAIIPEQQQQPPSLSSRHFVWRLFQIFSLFSCPAIGLFIVSLSSELMSNSIPFI